MNHFRTLGTVILALVIGTASSPAHAAWQFLPEAAVVALTDDNVRLRPDDLAEIDTASGTSIDARIAMSTTGERGNLFFEPRVRNDRYSDDAYEDLNGTDWFLRSRGRYDWENVSVGFRTDFDRQDVRDAETTDAAPDDPDIDDPTDPDTGLFLINQDRDRLLFRPYIDIGLSERTSLLLELETLDVTYSEAEFTGRVDFTNQKVAAGLVRRVDALNEVTARLVASEYLADFNQNETKTFGVEGTFRRPLSRGWTFNLAAGVSRSDYQFLNNQAQLVENADTSFTYGIGFRRRTDRNTVNIDVSQATSPNSNGFLTLRDEVRVYFNRALTQRLYGGVAVRLYSSKTLDDIVEDDQRDYGRVEFDIEWALKQRLYLTGGYTFTTQEFEDSFRPDASSNQVWVGFTYRGLSR